jgi:hypothetical protein
VNGVVRLWDLIDGRLLHDIPVEDEVRVVSLADDLDLVVGMSANLAVFRLAPDPGPTSWPQDGFVMMVDQPDHTDRLGSHSWVTRLPDDTP